MTRRLILGGMPLLLLTQACAEPLTARQLRERVEKRYGVTTSDGRDAARHAAQMVRDGWLRLVDKVPGRAAPAHRYTLTAAGEAQLEAYFYELQEWLILRSAA